MGLGPALRACVAASLIAVLPACGSKKPGAPEGESGAGGVGGDGVGAGNGGSFVLTDGPDSGSGAGNTGGTGGSGVITVPVVDCAKFGDLCTDSSNCCCRWSKARPMR